MATSA